MQRKQWSRDEYFADLSVSNSMMRCFELEGPLMAYHKYIRRDVVTDDTKDWQRMGTGFHLAMEDQRKFAESYLIVPTIVPDEYEPDAILAAEKKARGGVIDGSGSPLNKSWQRHKQYLAEMQAQAEMQGKDWLTEDEAAIIWLQVEAVWNNPMCAKYIGQATHGNKEVPLTAEIDGVQCKGLIDILREDLSTIVDFKTTRHRTKEAFVKDALGKGYQHQMAHYMQLSGCERAVIIAVTKEYPFEAMAYSFSQDVLQDAAESNSVTLSRIRGCLESGSWHTLGFGQLNIIGDEF